MFQEFKKFAMQGNVVDLAVGIIIGGAFGGIVTSLVQDVMMPIFGVAAGGLDFSQRYALLKEGAKPGPYESLAAAKAAGASVIGYGVFLFIVIKAMNSARQAKDEAPAAPPAPPEPTKEERLLVEIRDILKSSAAR
jgi:large conductance mechanosensitive channel